MVNGGLVKHISDGGVDLPRQEMVNAVTESNDTPQDKGVRRSRRNKTPGKMHVPSMQGKSYASGKYKGGGFPTVNNISTNWEELRNQFAGSEYCTKRRVINLQMHGTTPPPKMTESRIESHLVGVVMAQQYIMKKAKELFGDKADAAVMRELNQINDFETYVPLKASDLSWKEKKRALESLIFVTEKRYVDTKARTVADGSKQYTYDGYDKSDRFVTYGGH